MYFISNIHHIHSPKKDFKQRQKLPSDSSGPVRFCYCQINSSMPPIIMRGDIGGMSWPVIGADASQV